jgi:hypothetical protein
MKRVPGVLGGWSKGRGAAVFVGYNVRGKGLWRHAHSSFWVVIVPTEPLTIDDFLIACRLRSLRLGIQLIAK